MKYQQEIAPGAAMDRAEVVSVTETVETTVEKFGQCLKTAEAFAIEGGKAFKLYSSL
jgi:hypothetical protein